MERATVAGVVSEGTPPKKCRPNVATQVESIVRIIWLIVGMRNRRQTIGHDPSGHVVANAVITTAGRGYLVKDSLPPLGAGRTYQLWAVTGAAPVSAGLLGRDPGVAAFTIDAPTTALAISVEPTIGSSQPTAEPIAVGPVERT